MISKRAILATLTAIAASGPALAGVTISTEATQNMICSGGTCVPTATKAVLNITDLENYLSQFGNVRVMTTGNGVKANDIVVKAAFSSPDSTSLTLDAHKTITVDAAVSIGSGTAELELQSDTLAASDTLSFDPKGHITFGSLSDIFGINGGIFTLVGSIQGLASAVSANPSGAYALANSYDASQDGTYTSSPVATTFTGTFEGLGNTISRLSVDDAQFGDTVGLFATLGGGGVLEDLRLTKVRMIAIGPFYIGGLVGSSEGSLSGDYVSGKIRSRYYGVPGSAAGGLVGLAEGTITNCWTDATVESAGDQEGGGLVGWLEFGTVSLSHAAGSAKGVNVGGLIGYGYRGVVDQSYATGAVTSIGKGYWGVGGLVGEIDEGASILNSYATGTTLGKNGNGIGGLVGNAPGTYDKISGIGSSYSTGAPTGHRRAFVGGFLGLNKKKGAAMTDAYWDTTTSGTTKGVGRGNDAGVTGLTTQQLQSGLPTGFDPKIWAENPKLNNGLPYLIHNPPPK